ncbi:sensor histidine kinase [Cnuibacter physcomitrellae]|uniref:ATP-binding protein n=1 Tax=Cnuibacter physcomitrellae TaxID=1619308 RepID=UPI002175C6EE|nr:sensor histidine kinase [Cnuibacter physcomitrellae]MCS5498106.1 sensor histidine kinase [Cnuibacter physcomitrellae]
MHRRWSVATRLLVLQLAGVAVLAAGAVAFTVVGARSDAQQEASTRSVAVATSLAQNPLVVDAVSGPDPTATLQPYALDVMAASDVDFVTIMSTDGVRYTHRDPAQIGKHYLGTLGPALEGQTVVETYTGTLGPSVRAVAPVRDAAGEIVALVASGVTISRVEGTLAQRLPPLIGGVLGAALLVVLATVILGRYLGRVTDGRGPEEMARLFAYHESVLHSVREGLLLIDRRGRIALLNDQAAVLLGVPADSAGRRIADLPLEPDLESFLLADPAIGEDPGGEPVTEEVHLHAGRVLVLTRRPATQPRRGRRPARLLGTVVTLRDRTEIERLSGELDATRTLSDALRSQTHEHSNRMHVVASLVELGRYAEAVAFATDSTARSQHLADELFAGIEDAVVAALLLGKWTEARERGVEAEIDVSAGARWDPDLSEDLVVILGNLIDNSLDALARAPERRLGVRIAGGDGTDLELSVSDTGTGVPADLGFGDLARRGFSTKEHGAFGRGVGLALVDDAVRRRGGTVDLTAGEDGSGCVATVRIPARSLVGERRTTPGPAR